MKPLILAAALTMATIAQPWRAGDSVYHDATRYADYYLASEAAHFDMAMQGQLELVMLGKDGAALVSTDPVERCRGKAVPPAALRRAGRNGASLPAATRVCGL